MLVLNKNQLAQIACGRYDLAFGDAYHYVRTFSFPMKFSGTPLEMIELQENEVSGTLNEFGQNNLKSALEFLIASHYFWLIPDRIKDAYVLDVSAPHGHTDSHEIVLTYKDQEYYLGEEKINFVYKFAPPYTAKTTPGVFDKTALMHAAIGFPSLGFGDKLKKFDDGHFVPRLPSGDLLCIDHVKEVDPNHCVSTYHPPQNCCFALILEAALQPCGWLSHHMGCLDAFDNDAYFRNLNGDVVIHHPYTITGPITFDVKLLRTTKLGGKMIVNFDVQGYQNDQHIFSMQTTFGYFSKQSLEKQGGFPDELPQHSDTPKPVSSDLKNNKFFMVDEILYSNETSIHCRRALSPDDWYFKAHFFQDPVQPGSLGIQAFYDAVGLWAGQVVQPIGPCSWKYRGQTLPHHKILDVIVDITNQTPSIIEFTGKLFVDGHCIYYLEKASVLSNIS